MKKIVQAFVILLMLTNDSLTFAEETCEQYSTSESCLEPKTCSSDWSCAWNVEEGVCEACPF